MVCCCHEQASLITVPTTMIEDQLKTVFAAHDSNFVRISCCYIRILLVTGVGPNTAPNKKKMILQTYTEQITIFIVFSTINLKVASLGLLLDFRNFRPVSQLYNLRHGNKGE